MKNFSWVGHPKTAYAAECMEKIRDKLSKPKPVGNWWAHEVIARQATGHGCSIAAYELALKAIGPQPDREPGSDDE